MKHLNQSALSAAEDCMLKGQYTLHPPEWVVRVGGSSRALGTAYHAGIELKYVARRDGLMEPTLDDMIAAAIATFDTSIHTDLYDNTPIAEFKWAKNVPDRETAVEMLTQMLTEYVNGGHVWPTDWIVLGVEVHSVLDDPELGCRVKFGADLVLQAPDGGVVIVDQKTAGKAWAEGKSHPRKNVQAPFYLRLARILYPDAPYYRFVFDVMTLPGARTPPRFTRIISDPKPQHEAAIVARADAFLAVYNTVHVQMGRDLPANPNSTLCSPAFCDFFAGCAFGARLESPIQLEAA